MFIFLGFGMWFWVLVVLEFCLLTWFVEECWPLPSIVSLILFFVLLWWLADIPIWTWIKNNPAQLAMYCLYYIMAGIGWSIGKYYFLLSKVRKNIKKLKAEWMENKAKFEDDKIITFEDYISNNSFQVKYDLNFDNTAMKLTFWAMFWPTSFVWTILNEPVRRLFKFLIHDVFIGIYRKMHKVMITDLIKS
jgi:hypothetical protein